MYRKPLFIPPRLELLGGEARSRLGGDAIWQQLQTGVFQTGDGTRWGLGDRVRSTNSKIYQPRKTPGDKEKVKKPRWRESKSNKLDL